VLTAGGYREEIENMRENEKLGQKLRREKVGLSRRCFIKASAASASLPLLGRRGAWAADSENVIRVGFVSPRTGNLGTFGVGDEYLTTQVRKALDKGLPVGDKTYKVVLLDRDSQSDPARAGQLAKGLINEDKIDFMLVTSTPEVVNPVADACEAAGVPCLSTVMPWEAWYFGRGGKPGQPSPFKWTYHFAFGGAQFAGLYLSLWNQIPNNKKVGVMFPNDADGNAVRPLLSEAFKKNGYTVIDPGPFEDGTTDYSAQIALFKKERVDLFVALVLPPDFATMWRQAAQQGFAKTTKIATPTKSGTNPSEIVALGDLGYNLTTTSPWVPAAPYKSPVLGVTSQELADGYEAASGKQVTQQLGASNAVFDAGIQALQISGSPLDKAALAKTLSNLKVETTVGLIDFNTGPMPHVIAVTPLFGTQWLKAPKGSKWKVIQVVAENAADPNYKVTDKLISYNA
jgi:branched-chain amino acid transport system substrate-binding protein